MLPMTDSIRRALALGALLVCALASARSATAQTFRFDNGFQTPGGVLTFDYARPSPSVSQDGLLLPAGQARYTRSPRLLCGAPVVRTDIPISPSLGGALMAGAAGVGPDGVTPILLVYAGDPSRILLFQISPTGTLNQLLTKDTAYGDSSPHNVLRGEFADRNVEGIRYAPTTAFSVCHGLIMAVCQVHTLSGSEWTRVRTAVCYYDLAAPTLGWRCTDIGPGANTQPGMNRGSPFQMPGYHVLDEGPVLRAWFPFSDYVLNNQPTTPGSPTAYSATGVFYLMNAVRNSVGAPWTVGPMAPVYSPPSRLITPMTVNLGQHAHPPYVERFGAQGLRMVCPVGDSWARNRVVTVYRGNEDYSQPGWAVFENMHGSAGTEFDAAVGVGNQFVGSAPLGTPYLPLGHAVGTDESGVAIAVSPPSDNPGEKLRFMRAYGQPTCSSNHGYAPARPYAWNTFHIRSAAAEQGGPYVAQMLPGMQAGWMYDITVPRVLYSLDGLTWGQAWATQDIQPWPPVIAGGRIFVGSADRARSFGVRSIPLPAVHGAHPLMVGDGGVNLLRAGDGEEMLAVQSVDAGNRVFARDRARIAARGIPLPPTVGPLYECMVGAQLPVAASRRIATWRLTSASAFRPAFPGYTVKAKVRAWVYPLPADGTQPHANSVMFTAALGRFDPLNPSNPVSAAREEISCPSIPVSGDAAMGWIPLTLDTDSSRWTNDLGQVSQTKLPFALGLRLRAEQGLPVNRCAFLIAFESVLEGAGSSYGVPPVGSGAFAGDAASVGGFSCGPEWTVRLAGEVPDDAWDQTLEPGQVGTPLTLCTLFQDADNHLQVLAEPESRSLKIVQTRGGTAATYPLKPRGDFTQRERFCFLRGSPVLLSVSQLGDKLSVNASVGGSMIATCDLPNVGVRPSRVVLGNHKGARPAAMLWYGGRVDAFTGMTNVEASSSLASLSFLSN